MVIEAALEPAGKVFGGGLFDKTRTPSRWTTSRSPSTASRRAIIAVVGESGSGKTTLARLLLG